MFKKILRFIGFTMLFFILLILVIGLIYFIKPEFIQNKAIGLISPTVNIEDQYINAIVVENPEVYELMHIACGLTSTCQNDKNLLYQKTVYYEAVEQHFSKLSQHPLVQAIDAKLQTQHFTQTLGGIRVLSLNYDINKDNEIIQNNTIRINPILFSLVKSMTFSIPDHLDLIEDFAKKSNFKTFYQTHQSTFSTINNQYNKLCDFEDMQDWLEEKFDNKAQSYRIIHSPLTGGFHNTISFMDKKRQAKQNFMFVNAPRFNIDTLNDKQFIIAASRSARIVFTEIDHNYVNPLSDKFKEQLLEVMPNHKKWNEEKQGYRSPMSTFNEYMTWGVFSLYALDTYPEKQLDEILEIQATFMNDFRGFKHFKDFNAELIRIYKDKGKPKIKALYPHMLDWIKKYHQ